MSHWLFVLDEDLVWQSPIKPRDAAEFIDELGQVWLRIDDEGAITISKGYAWNGCSPTIKLLDWGYIGTPNGTLQSDTNQPKTYVASLVHDALYQFMDDPKMPYSRKQMDQMFLRLLKDTEFSLRYLYYGALRLLGGPYMGCKKTTRRWRGES